MHIFYLIKDNFHKKNHTQGGMQSLLEDLKHDWHMEGQGISPLKSSLLRVKRIICVT